MNSLKRSCISLKRNPGKSTLIFLLVTILGVLASGAISVNQAFTNTEINLRRTLPPIVTIESVMDRETAEEFDRQLEIFNAGGEFNWMDERGAGDFITLDHIREIGRLPYVALYDYSFPSFQFHFGIGLEWVNYYLDSPFFYEHPLTVQFVHRPEFIDLYGEVIEIHRGRTFIESELASPSDLIPILVSEKFANHNHLEIGSSLEFYSNLFNNDSEVYRQITLQGEIIGTFAIASEITSSRNPGFNEISTDHLLNLFYVPTWINDIWSEALDNHMQSQGWEFSENLQEVFFPPIFSLRDMTYIEAFEEAVSEILPTPPGHLYIVQYLSNIYEEISGAMHNLGWVFSLVLSASISAVIVILTLLITLFLKDRKQELGIYMAMGEKKLKVVFQLWLEVLIIGALGLIISLLIGNVLARNFSQQLLEQELIRVEEERARLPHEGVFHPSFDPLFFFSPEPMSHEEMLSHFNVGLSSGTAIIFMATGIALLIISTTAPIVYILTLEPKKVLM